MTETVQARGLRRRWRGWRDGVLPAVIVAGLAVSEPLYADPAIADNDSACPAFDFAPSSTSDYRSRDSTPSLRWSIDDNMASHTGPAIERIRAGEYSRRVLSDLNFTLRHWPNHLLALQALINYKLAGGKQYEFMSAECYFARARQFVPDDIGVILIEAYYRWKKGDAAAAIALYETALKIDPDSADAHYNLGLMYVEQGNYARAGEHARAAYAAGYPLPGLRNKLAAAGYSEEHGNVAGAANASPEPGTPDSR